MYKCECGNEVAEIEKRYSWRHTEQMEMRLCVDCYDERKEFQSMLNYFNYAISSVIADLKAGERMVERWNSEERPRLESELQRYQDKFEENLKIKETKS